MGTPDQDHNTRTLTGNATFDTGTKLRYTEHTGLHVQINFQKDEIVTSLRTGLEILECLIFSYIWREDF